MALSSPWPIRESTTALVTEATVTWTLASCDTSLLVFRADPFIGTDCERSGVEGVEILSCPFAGETFLDGVQHIFSGYSNEGFRKYF